MTEAHKDTLEFDLGVTLHSGVHIPIEIVVTYPEGMGLHAVQALIRAMDTQANELFQQLVNQGDASVIQALLKKGYELEEED